MWLFTRIGFFSIVQKEGQSYLTVRTRVEADLDRLRQQYMPELSETLHRTGSDYLFRATISKEAFSAGLQRIGQDINYSNFKHTVSREMGSNRAHIYYKVWSILTQLERTKDD